MRVTFLVAATLALSVSAFAQTVGQVTGVVTDPSGSVVVGATVFTIDSTVKKDIKFTERRYLQLRLDAFNTLNHPNFGDPGNTLVADQLANGVPIPGTGSFGRITSTKTGVDMRELQVSLKLIF